MFIIHLNNLKFYSFHGLYPEEKLLGGEYEVNAEVLVESTENIIDIKQTADYIAIYDVIKKQMSVPTELLETIAQHMVNNIGQLDNRIKKVSIIIKKTHPPIEQFTGNISVSYSKEF
ncbi:MAG: dihydroneopterin aldolase [Ferruginibacter sp.]